MSILLYSSVDDMDVWRGYFESLLPKEKIYLPGEFENAEKIEYAAMWEPPSGMLSGLPNLKVVFSLGAGVDHLFKDKSFPRHIPVVRVIDPGLTEQMCEYVLLHVMYHHRRMWEYNMLQRKGEWNLLETKRVHEVRVGVMGLGVLGMAVAKVLRDFGFSVAGWSRARKKEKGIECFAGPNQWDEFLGKTEILVCLLPLTSATRRILSMKVFKKLACCGDQMRGPVLINPGRGGHMVEEDVLAALESGVLGGASLDVFDQEPLGAESRFWSRDNVIVTPHSAAATDPIFVASSIRDNLARLKRGEKVGPLAHVERGY